MKSQPKIISEPAIVTQRAGGQDGCLPWLWPMFAYNGMVAGRSVEAIGEQLAERSLRVTSDLLKFVEEAHKIDYELKPQWATLNTTKLDLKTMLLRNFSVQSEQKVPVIIDAPYAGHSATIADFAVDQSLVHTLKKMDSAAFM